jgi:hypothetical protein
VPKPRDILLVDHEAELGGAELSLCDLLRGLDRSRFTPHVACSTEGPLTARARALGATVHLVSMAFRSRVRKAVGLWRAAAALRDLIARTGVRLVHANTLIAGYPSVVAARRADVPSVWHVRDASYPRIARAACRRADRIVANSHATAATLGAHGVTVIHNGVPPEFFAARPDREAVRRELGWPADTLLCGMAGRLDPWKGHRVLLDAAAQVLLAAPRAAFVVAGDVLFAHGRAAFGGYRAELEARALALGIADRVRFVGPRADLPRLLASCDAFVHPSVAPEPFGRAVAEAQAAGLPVVASRLGGIPEIVQDGRTGLLCDAGDARALAAALARVLTDAGLRERFGDAARANAAERFTLDAHVRAVTAVWDELLAGAHALR